MLDDEGLDVLQVGDAMRRPRGEFFVSNEDETVPARRQERALETDVPPFADTVFRVYRSG